MIYCPHCKKPSAVSEGKCPHCKQDLQITEQITEQVSAQPEKPAGAPSEFVLDSDEYAPNIGKGSGLELDSIAPPAPRSAPQRPNAVQTASVDTSVPTPSAGKGSTVAAPKVDDAKVRKIANFQAPAPGIIGTVNYWRSVRSRLRELAAEYNVASRDSHEADVQKDVIFCELGMAGHKAGLDDSFGSLLSRAILAQEELAGSTTQKESLTKQHEQAKAKNAEELATIEQIAAPLRREEEQTKYKYDDLASAHKGVEVQQKRIDIELRNIEELIKRHQKSYADLEKPKEEREKLLEQIAELDKRTPAIQKKREDLDKELDQLEEPFKLATENHKKALSVLNIELEKISALEQEFSQLEQSYAAQIGQVSSHLDSINAKAQTAWVAVGERILTLKEPPKEIEKVRMKALVAREDAQAAEQKLSLLDAARESYDKTTFEKAKKILMVGGAGAALLIAFLVYLVQ